MLTCLLYLGLAADADAVVTISDIRSYLLKNSPWVNANDTVDTVKAGDPNRPAKKVAVCWYASIDTLRKAHEAGCDGLICHEPTFWEHAAPERQWRTKDPGKTKQVFLERTGMVILRAHDSWDQWPEIGIRDSWARFLGLTKCVYASKGNRYRAVYETEPQPLETFAQAVADRVAPLGEDSVRIMGDPKRIVRRVAVGVGCIGPDAECVEAGADAVIVCYDGASYWSTRERLYEMGAAVVTVEHGTCEMPGMENLCKHLAGRFPSVTFQYFAEHPRTWTVRGR